MMMRRRRKKMEGEEEEEEEEESYGLRGQPPQSPHRQAWAGRRGCSSSRPCLCRWHVLALHSNTF
jgi:hypothetical protein